LSKISDFDIRISNLKDMEEELTIETSRVLQDLFYRYTHLSLGGKKIVCPYWMNNLEKGIYGPIGGKGRPEEVVNAVKEAAKEEKIDLNRMPAEEIVLFMKAKRIGVDCSGFVFWMLDELDKEKGGNGIANDIPGAEGKVIKARANTRMLTDDKVSLPVEKVKEIKVGDMIRMRRGRHVAIVLSVERNPSGIIKSIEYAHSSNAGTKVSGVHKAAIKIVDSNKGLREQKWLERTINEESYGENIFLQEGDGIKRLKIWS